MYRVGIDLGGMTIKCGIVDYNGKIYAQKNIPTESEKGSEHVIQNMKNLILELINEFNITIDDIKSIGIGSPGTIDIKQGILIHSYNLNFDNVHICKSLSQKLQKPVYLENDANCASICEFYAGAAKDYNTALVITLGTGVGGGYIKNGKCQSGAFFNGGELGHMVLSVNGRQCTCGRRGCLEAYCSATSLIAQSVKYATTFKESILNKIVQGDLNKLNPKVLFEAKDQGCQYAVQIINEFNLYLSEGIANYINILEPEIVLLGGGISKQGEKLLSDIRPLVYKKCYNKNSKVKINIAKHFNDAGIIGASFLGQ